MPEQHRPEYVEAIANGLPEYVALALELHRYAVDWEAHCADEASHGDSERRAMWSARRDNVVAAVALSERLCAVLTLEAAQSNRHIDRATRPEARGPSAPPTIPTSWAPAKRGSIELSEGQS